MGLYLFISIIFLSVDKSVRKFIQRFYKLLS